MVPKENSSEKNYRSEFLQPSFIFVIYLLTEVSRKILSHIYFVANTRYEDLSETGPQACFQLFVYGLKLIFLLKKGAHLRYESKFSSLLTTDSSAFRARVRL